MIRGSSDGTRYGPRKMQHSVAGLVPDRVSGARVESANNPTLLLA
jgi:hypothetical protein